MAGEKSAGQNHYEVIALLNKVTPSSNGKTKALEHLKELIDHKNFVSYSGEIYYKKDVEKLLKNFARFRTWADEILV